MTSSSGVSAIRVTFAGQNKGIIVVVVGVEVVVVGVVVGVVLAVVVLSTDSVTISLCCFCDSNLIFSQRDVEQLYP